MDDQKTDESHLEFLRDEGLEMLFLFRKIREKEKRELVLDLIRALVDTQAPVNGTDGLKHT